MEIKNPGNVKPCTTLWAVLSVDKNGNEGICMFNVPPFGPVLAVTGDEENLEHYKMLGARGAHEARAEGLKVVIGKFERVGSEVLSP